MRTVVSKPFRSGNSEAVRLPKDMAFGVETEVELKKVGNVLTIRPRDGKDPMAALKRLREMPGPAEILPREPFEFPDRPGL